MEPVGSTPSIPFRSKKPSLQATPIKPSQVFPDDKPALLETPEKSNRPSRLRNPNIALSIKDVKRKAHKLSKRGLNQSDLVSDPPEGVRSGSDLRVQISKNDPSGGVMIFQRSVKLPEKYQILYEFFSAMVSGISLSKMRGISPTFSNICSKIQSMTDRRFTINNLAQLKYILPEVIVVKKIRLQDEHTACMKEELLISLDTEVVKAGKSVKDIRAMFRARIMDYYESHNEEDDIPEGELPAMFYPQNQTATSSMKMSTFVASASHVPKSFQRSFARKTLSENSDNQGIQRTPTVQLVKPLVSETSPPANVYATPVKNSSVALKDGLEESIGIQGTPVKEAFTPIRLMASTPAIKPSKRSFMSPDDDDDDDSCNVPSKLIRRANRTRSLTFDSAEDSGMSEAVADDDASGSKLDSDVTESTPRNLLQSVRENEKKMLEDQDPAISQARKHQLMSGLPKLFDMIHLLFQSINRSVLTREELVFKVIASQCDIIDRGEVEEQLKLLLELVPEYLSEQVCSSGDTLVRLSRSINAESVRAMLLHD